MWPTKVNMLAREYCSQTKPKIKHKPVILSHHMLAGLKEGQEKMSKSDPGTCLNRTGHAGASAAGRTGMVSVTETSWKTVCWSLYVCDGG